MDKILLGDAMKLPGPVVKRYGVKGMKWGRRKAESEDPVEQIAAEMGGAASDLEEELEDAMLESTLQVQDKAALVKTYLNPEAHSAKPEKDAGFKAIQFVNNLFGDKRPPIERNIDFMRKMQDATRPIRKFFLKLEGGN